MMTKTYEDQLRELALADERIIVMTAENRAAIRGLPDVLGDRFLDTGITEQTMVGAAAGLALQGRIPICHALAVFLTMRAFEFVRTDVGIGRLPVKLVGGVPGLLSDGNGPTHQALEDIALMRGIPGMRVYSPADEAELVEALPVLIDDPHPVYIRHVALPPAIEHTEPFVFGEAERVASGTDLTILVHGFLLREVVEVRRLLQEAGIDAGVVNMRSLAPVDKAAILEAAAAGPVAVVEDHFLTGGLVTLVAETLLEARLSAHVIPIALEGWFRPALLEAATEAAGLNAATITNRITRELS